MTAERCRHCGGRIEYDEPDPSEDDTEGWWIHTTHPLTSHVPAPAFGGGS